MDIAELSLRCPPVLTARPESLTTERKKLVGVRIGVAAAIVRDPPLTGLARITAAGNITGAPLAIFSINSNQLFCVSPRAPIRAATTCFSLESANRNCADHFCHWSSLVRHPLPLFGRGDGTAPAESHATPIGMTRAVDLLTSQAKPGPFLVLRRPVNLFTLPPIVPSPNLPISDSRARVRNSETGNGFIGDNCDALRTVAAASMRIVFSSPCPTAAASWW